MIRNIHPLRLLASLLIAISVGFLLEPSVLAAAKLEGQWTLAITIPDAPNSASTTTRTFNMHVSPRDGSLHGRVTMTDQAGRTVSGAWRQVGKSVSIAFELPCPGDVPCASVILLGKVKGGGFLIKKGTVIIMWDTANNKNPALFDTSNGSFRGDRLQ